MAPTKSHQRQWLVISDSSEHLILLKHQLESLGDRVIGVSVGETYRKIKDDSYCINITELDDVTQLFDDIADEKFSGVISCLGFQEQVGDIPKAQLAVSTGTLYVVQSLLRQINMKN